MPTEYYARRLDPGGWTCSHSNLNSRWPMKIQKPRFSLVDSFTGLSSDLQSTVLCRKPRNDVPLSLRGLSGAWPAKQVLLKSFPFLKELDNTDPWRCLHQGRECDQMWIDLLPRNTRTTTTVSYLLNACTYCQTLPEADNNNELAQFVGLSLEYLNLTFAAGVQMPQVLVQYSTHQSTCQQI